MATPNMDTITAFLEISLQNCSLNHRQSCSNGGGPPHSPNSPGNPSYDAASALATAALELNSQVSLPAHWEQCLHLKVMTSLILIYIGFVCYDVANMNNAEGEQERRPSVKSVRQNGLSADDLEKLPKVTGEDLLPGSDCAVCLDEIEGEQLAKLIPGCDHWFHAECIDVWLSKNPACPICRAVIVPELLGPTENNPC